ncbi:hypothetical protein M9Y10_002455 [Tritrichomonas musculus]|uniref:Uncharacterized protein n=1 Tax=Tritrichomonas musculus TaxID=1915356 RepID=A0ABR2LA77_9EUKA
MLLLFLGISVIADDRRLDPFQFNLCVWDLEGLDPRYTLLLLKDEDTREKEENAIAEIMYSSLSTCDMFVLPGLRNHTTAKNLVRHMDDHFFTDFVPYPLSGRYDSTILSRIDLDNTSDIRPDLIDFPIENSKCNYTGTGKASTNMSFYGTLHFHEPVPLTHVFSVRLKSNHTPYDCAYREAQAKNLCRIISGFPKEEHIYIAGSFEANPDDPYHSVLEECGLIDTWKLAKKGSYTRKDPDNGTVYQYDTIWVNDAVQQSKYLDILSVVSDENSKLIKDLKISTSLKTIPFTLYTRQPLTKKWRKFEIAFSSTIVPVSIGFFVWLLIFSTDKKDLKDNYNTMSG